MMHNNRVWCVSPVETAEELADKLTQYSWCCCTGFELDDYLWLNDATGPDGAQEYAVVRKPTGDGPHFWQVESITASWCTERQLLAYIKLIHEDKPSPQLNDGPVIIARSGSDLRTALGTEKRVEGFIVHPRIESPEVHRRCSHCA